MYSSRRYSVQRHIRIIHEADATPIPFVEYMAGRTNGQYPPARFPVFHASEFPTMQMMYKQTLEIYYQRVVEKALQDLPDSAYTESVKILKAYLSKKASSEFKSMISEEFDQIWKKQVQPRISQTTDGK
jgi:hypothetical protein